MNLMVLHKLVSIPAAHATGEIADDMPVIVSIRLNEHAERPDYIFWKAQVTAVDYTIKVKASELARIDADPAVQSFELYEA